MSRTYRTTQGAGCVRCSRRSSETRWGRESWGRKAAIAVLSSRRMFPVVNASPSRLSCSRLEHRARPGWYLAFSARLEASKGSQRAVSKLFSRSGGVPAAWHRRCGNRSSEEDEFFALESFCSRGDFLANVHTISLYLKLARVTPTSKISALGRSSSVWLPLTPRTLPPSTRSPGAPPERPGGI
jgi:hypothetical protein